MTLANFQLYDDAKRRVSIFGEINDNFINITVIPCSKKNTFVKRESWRLYRERTIDGKPLKGFTRTSIPIIKGQKPKETFLEWCEKTYNERIIVTDTFRYKYIKRYIPNDIRTEK